MPYLDELQRSDPDQLYGRIKRQAKRERRQAMRSLMRTVFRWNTFDTLEG